MSELQIDRAGTRAAAVATRRHGTHNAYASGCRCDECREAHNAAVREWQYSKIAVDPAGRQRYPYRAAQSSALSCACGGLLAEDNRGQVYCLACESPRGGV